MHPFSGLAFLTIVVSIFGSLLIPSKTRCDLGGRNFHVEKCENGWQGRFSDSPSEVFQGELKNDVLRQVGYSAQIVSERIVSRRGVASGKVLEDNFPLFEGPKHIAKYISRFPRFGRDVINRLAIKDRQHETAKRTGTVSEFSPVVAGFASLEFYVLSRRINVEGVFTR